MMKNYQIVIQQIKNPYSLKFFVINYKNKFKQKKIIGMFKITQKKMLD